MQALPFTQNRISPQDREVVLIERRVPPTPAMVKVGAGIGGLAGLIGGLERFGDVFLAFLVGLAVYGLALQAMSWLYYIRTGQLRPRALLANDTYILGHVLRMSRRAPPNRFAWADVLRVRLWPESTLQDFHVLYIDVALKNGGVAVLLLPPLTPQEWSDLCDTLEAIAHRCDFRFEVAANALDR